MLWVDNSIHALSRMAGAGGRRFGVFVCRSLSILVSLISVVQGEISPGLVGYSPILAVCPEQVAFLLLVLISCAVKQRCRTR